jgi:hypothetical protein
MSPTRPSQRIRCRRCAAWVLRQCTCRWPRRRGGRRCPREASGGALTLSGVGVGAARISGTSRGRPFDRQGLLLASLDAAARFLQVHLEYPGPGVLARGAACGSVGSTEMHSGTYKDRARRPSSLSGTVQACLWRPWRSSTLLGVRTYRCKRQSTSTPGSRVPRR